MAKSKTISFIIQGNDQLSAVLANAQKNLRGLAKSTLSANAKALQNAQAALKNVEAYKKLQAAISATSAAQIQNRADQGKLFKQRQEAVAQLSDMKKAYAQLQDAYKANRRSMGTEAANTFKEQLKAASNEIKAQERVVKNLDRAYNSLPAQARKLHEQLANQQTQLAQLRTQLPTANIAAAEAALRAQIQQTTQALNQEIAALERRNQIQQNFSRAGQDLSNAYANFQNALDTAQTIMNPFTEAADNAMTFEKAISRLKSLTQMRNLRAGNLSAVETEMASMTATIEKLGMTTEYTANQIAGAANFYAMSGWSSKQINAMLPTTTDLASIAQIPIDRVADMLSDDMTAFGVKAGEGYKLAGGKVVDGAKYFGDAVAYATTQANLDFSTFHESWKYNAPVAHAMGLSLGESIAQNMILANAGIKGSMSGTSLRQFWVRMSAPPKAAQKSLEEMGFAANDATQQIMNTQAAMQEAGVSMDSDLFTKIAALEKYYQAGKAAGRDMTGWLKGLTGQTALSGVMSLFDMGKLDEAKRYAQEIDSGFISGWSGETAAIMRDNARTSIDYLTSALDALQKAGGDALLPTIRDMAEAVTPLVASFAQWTKQNPQVVKSFAMLAAAISAATVALAGFSLAMAGIRFAQAGLATAGLVFGDLATKLTTLRTALAGLTVANIGATLSSGLAGASAAMRAFGSSILVAARAGLAFMFTPIGAALTAIALAAYFAYQNWDKVSAAFGKIGNALSSSIGPALSATAQAFGNLMSHFSGLGSIVSTLADAIGGTLVGTLVGALGFLGSALSGTIVLIAGLLKTVADLASGVVEAFSKLSDGDFSGAFAGLTSAAEQAAQNFRNSFKDAQAAVKAGFEGTVSALNDLTIQQTPSVADFSAINQGVDTSQIVQPIADASTQTATSLLQVQSPADVTGQSLMQLPPAIDATTSATTNLTSALPAPIDGLNQVAGASSNAAGALEGAAARFNAIQINVPQVNFIPMNVPVVAPPVMHNASGGIYSKGAFLTTFAESSGEAAIPLNQSARSKSLWTQTGEALGMFNDSTPPISLNLTFNIQGNADSSTVNQMRSEVVPLIERTFAEQLAAYQHEQRRRSFI